MRQSGIETKIQMNSQPHAIMLTSPQTDNGEARIDRKNEIGPKADLKEMKVIRTIFFNSRFGTSSGCSLALFGGCYFEILLGVYWFVLVCLRSLPVIPAFEGGTWRRCEWHTFVLLSSRSLRGRCGARRQVLCQSGVSLPGALHRIV